ncbi:MAG: hypothetical protein KGJ13_00530 [Patescibacteria group bacterium]|nr:hypothetical protein [Patescibacteria group bacterium]
MDFVSSQLQIFLQSVGAAWNAVWWIVVPAIALVVFLDFWLIYVRSKFLKAVTWQLLEIKIPKNVLKTPKAMEQIFAAAHTPYSFGIKKFNKWFKGQVELWMSFEIMGRAGESHFYLRLPSQFRNMMEAAIYSQYPEVEITEAEDYVAEMPQTLPNKDIQIFGYDQILGKENYYPILTYPAFEANVEEQRLDSIALLMEGMAKLKDEEQMWMQILVTPTGTDWGKEGEKAVNKILGIEEKKTTGGGLNFSLGVTLGEALTAPFQHPSMEPAKPQKSESQNLNLKALAATPIMKEVTEGIQRKISKLAFETTVRFLYLDRRESFKGDNINSVTGFFRQFYTQHMNFFRVNLPTLPIAKGFFKKTKIELKRHALYTAYRIMRRLPKQSILNIEELATIYHFPIAAVTTTELEKIASRKGSPPASVPTIED